MHYNRRLCISGSENECLFTDRELSEAAGFKVITGTAQGFRFTSIHTGSLTDTASQRRAADALFRILRQYLGDSRRQKRYLAAGIGNPEITPDSLGPRCIGRLVPSPDTSPALFTVTPNIPAKTGIDSAKTIRAAAEIVRADCIITADALAAVSQESLASVIQVTDQGTFPGSGTGESESSIICSESMGIPVISVGVPTVMESGEFLVTPADCDRVTDVFSRVLAWGITNALYR